MTKSKFIMQPRKPWTSDQIAKLIARYPHEPTAALVKVLGHKIGSIYRMADKLGIKKTSEYLSGPHTCRICRGDNIGAENRFQPGHKTWNKGMKGLDIGGHETRFKKGHLGGSAALKQKPIGAERISKGGYRQRKINNDLPFYKRWKAIHHIEWEARNGPIPKGFAITFIDGNQQNCAPDNLKLISRRDLMGRNTVHNLPKPLAELVQLRGAINSKINRLNKGTKDEQRNNS